MHIGYDLTTIVIPLWPHLRVTDIIYYVNNVQFDQYAYYMGNYSNCGPRLGEQGLAFS